MEVRRQATAARGGQRWLWVVEKEVLGFGWRLERKVLSGVLIRVVVVF